MRFVEEEPRVGEGRTRDARHLLLAGAQISRKPPFEPGGGLMNVYTQTVHNLCPKECGHPMEDWTWSAACF